MDRYIYQLSTRLDGKYYCRIFQLRVQQQLEATDDYDEQKDAIEAAEALIQEHQANTAEA
jgi:hypothetical protein